MANDEMRDEIEALRAQVAELTAERKAKEKEQAQASSSQESTKESTAQGTASSESGTDETEVEKLDETDLSSQVQELIDTIDQELKEASPVTVLVVFALGVLVGRLLPR